LGEIEHTTQKAILLVTRFGKAWVPKREAVIVGNDPESLEIYPENQLPPEARVLWMGARYVIGFLVGFLAARPASDKETKESIRRICDLNPGSNDDPLPVYKVTYGDQLLTHGIPEGNLRGFDAQSTDREFRKQVNMTLSASYPVLQVADYQVVIGDSFSIEPLSPNCSTADEAHRRVDDLFINRTWVRYSDADWHIMGLVNVTDQAWVNHVLTMGVFLPEIYGVSRHYVSELITEYRDEGIWANVRFTIGGMR